MKIAGGVFVVTGGASGLGAATARMIARNGGKIAIADLNAAAGAMLERELGGKAKFAQTDVTSETDASLAIRSATALGPLRGLVNCAGVAPAEKILGKQGPLKLESFQRTIAINLVGTFNMLRLAAEAMAANQPDGDGARGVIVNTASIAAFDGQIGQAAYAASKGAIVAMTLPIARELARFGIRVMTIAPGVMETPMMQAMPAEVREALDKSVPFPSRMGRPEEFAGLVEHILANPYLNGEVIRLDGAIRMASK